MKVQIHSDLHLEFDKTEGYADSQLEVRGDILVLAGDIVTSPLRMFNYLEPMHNKWELILIVLGNHEHYFGMHHMCDQRVLNYKQTVSALDNVVILSNESLQYKGFKFYGGTMWTDMEDPDRCLFRNYMTDFNYVTPFEIEGMNKSFHLMLPEEVDMVISHHAPSRKSIAPIFEGSPLNGLYAESYSKPLETVNARYWVHGHMHNPVDYEEAGTKVISNPRGYCGMEKRAEEIQYLVVDLDEKE